MMHFKATEKAWGGSGDLSESLTLHTPAWRSRCRKLLAVLVQLIKVLYLPKNLEQLKTEKRITYNWCKTLLPEDDQCAEVGRRCSQAGTRKED